MTKSQNGWPGVTSSADLQVLSWITGRVLPGDVWTILDHLCSRFDVEVEKIVRSSSWGWNYRPVVDGTDLSNHASATAVDLNAPQHPISARGTFTAEQVNAIERILGFFNGVIRWGGHYKKRADEMHFEIDVSPADPRVAALAGRIRALTAPPIIVVPDPEPSLTDKQLAQILGAIEQVPLRTAQFPIPYSEGTTIWLQDSANQFRLLQSLTSDVASQRHHLTRLETSMPSMTKQAVLDALAVSPITTTTTIGGKP